MREWRVESELERKRFPMLWIFDHGLGDASTENDKLLKTLMLYSAAIQVIVTVSETLTKSRRYLTKKLTS